MLHRRFPKINLIFYSITGIQTYAVYIVFSGPSSCRLGERESRKKSKEKEEEE